MNDVCVLTVTWFGDFPLPERTTIVGVYASLTLADKAMEKLAADPFFKVGKIMPFTVVTHE